VTTVLSVSVRCAPSAIPCPGRPSTLIPFAEQPDRPSYASQGAGTSVAVTYMPGNAVVAAIGSSHPYLMSRTRKLGALGPAVRPEQRHTCSGDELEIEAYALREALLNQAEVRTRLSTHDAVIVGARCAGSVLATRLARAGWDILLVDQATFPSDTVSTHFVFPNTLGRLERLGVMERLTAAHDVPRLLFSWNVLGETVAGPFTPIAGYERMSCIRRVVLDHALVETAVEAGATTRFGVGVSDLITERDGSVAGVILQGGERARARWVFGADGRNSTVARRLGLTKRDPLRGEMSMLFAYWTGLPESEWFRLEVWEDRAITSSPCEDDNHLLVVAGGPELVRGDRHARQARYLEWLRKFPDVIGSRALDGGRQVSDLVVAPEGMMRGFFRQANGVGWALLGDAGHYKHPSTAQGISDAIEQADHVADGLLGEDPNLEGYEQWRDTRAEEHYVWSFRSASWPVPEKHLPIHAGLAMDETAGQEFRDMFTRLHQPSDVYTSERVVRWAADHAVDRPSRPGSP